MSNEETQVDKVKKISREICLLLDIDPSKPPIGLSINQTSEVLGVTSGTLNLWRSTGRYCLPYIKMGHLIRYQIDDLSAFIIRRTMGAKDADK